MSVSECVCEVRCGGGRIGGGSMCGCGAGHVVSESE